MSTIFVSGKKGGGKSYYTMKLICEELVFGDRPVLTNMSIKWPQFMEYLDTQYPSRKSDWFKRILILDRDECYHFWRYRMDTAGRKAKLTVGKSARIIEGRSVEDFQIDTPDHSTGDRGIFYVIDEAQNFFSSYADWKDIGPEAMWYSEQERKWGDDELMVSPGGLRIVKAWRDQGQEFHYLRNWAKERLSRFRGPGYFQRTIMNKPATGTMTDIQARVDYFRLDKRLADCYDTNAGVGVVGVRGDLGKVAKGVSLMWIIPALALLGFMVWKAPDLLAYGFVKGFTQHKPAAVLGAVVSTNAQTVAIAPSVPPVVPPHPLSSRGRFGRLGGFSDASSQFPYSAPSDVVVDAVAQLPGGKVWIHLSDGRTLVNPAHGVLTSDGLLLGKDFYPVKAGSIGGG